MIWYRIQQKLREGRTDFDLSPRKKVTNGPKSKNWSIVLEEIKKKFLLTKDLLLDHFLLQQTFQGDTGKCTHFLYLMFSIIKIISDHIIEKINLMLVLI